jgi:hypothetical protein
MKSPEQLAKDILGIAWANTDLEPSHFPELRARIAQALREARAEGVRWAADHIDDGAEGVGHYYAEQIRRNVPAGEDSKP